VSQVLKNWGPDREGPLFTFLSGRFSTARLHYDLAFWFFWYYLYD
jgi:hypothetical protein